MTDTRRPRAVAVPLAVAAFLAALIGSAWSATDSQASAEQLTRQFVVAAIGDSYGAGEGAPQVDGNYAYGPASSRWVGVPAAVWDSSDSTAARCHRSPDSGFGQAVDRVRRTFAPLNVRVRFRSFACSGASIRFATDPLTGLRDDRTTGGGALTSYCGAAPTSCPGTQAPVAPQVQQLRSAFGTTAVDALLVSLGGNDFGFGRTIFVCAITEYLGVPGGAAPCDRDVSLQAMVSAAGTPTTASSLEARLPELQRGDVLGEDALARGCAFLSRAAVVARTCTPTLRASYDLLGRALRGQAPRTFVRCSAVDEAAAEAAWLAAHPLSLSTAPVGTVAGSGCEKRLANSVAEPLGIWVRAEATYPTLARAPDRVYVTTYPDAVEDETGALCDNRPADDRFTRGILSSESSYIRRVMQPVLNAEVQGAAQRNQWTVVNLPAAARHGICATAGQRWFNTNRDSLEMQGEMGATAGLLSTVRAAQGVLGVTDGEPALGGGLAHPNAAGYRSLYSGRVGERLRLQICSKFGISPCPGLLP